MAAVRIPIRSLPAADEDLLAVLPMPREMNTFEMPRLPEPGPGNDVAGARDVLRALLGYLDRWLEHGGDPPALDLRSLAPDALRVLNESLGEGEVAATVDTDASIRIQETVFPGVWREQHVDRSGALLHDYLLAAPIPPLLIAAAQAGAAPTLRTLALPDGAMNVAALVAELQDAVDRSGPGTPAHVINLTLLPLSADDSAHLDRLLDGGAVVILSRGFGNCRISSTAARNVWRVQYFNAMQTLVLNTIEVTTVPDGALAAREDLLETRDRLADWLEWMSESIAAG
jgi:hydrogenase-1 operon protein HyaF